LLKELTPDKRLITFPENLQGETSIRNKTRKKYGVLDTGLEFFSDILETEEAAATTPEREEQEKPAYN